MNRVLFFAFILFVASCSGNSTASNGDTTISGDGTTLAASSTTTSANGNTTEIIVDRAASTEADAISGATNVANAPSFNGLFVLPPQGNATIALSMGGIVQSTSLLEGKYVKKGEVVALLDNPDFIDLQQNALDAMRQLDYLEKEYKRQSVLVEKEAASQKRFQQVSSEYYAGRHKFEALSAKLRLLGVDMKSLVESGRIMERMEVRSPISGYVTNASVNIGKYIAPGEPICSIIDKSNMMLKLTAYEKDLDKLSVGDNLDFTVNGVYGQTFKAKVISIDQSVELENRSINVYAKVLSSNSLFRPGMYVSCKKSTL
ncbi:MAG: efflux RND transporter periplasmic adaptor subunit [Candidatus Egerieousia sp.]|nr:efflux RND transporter periplasmic adaptor subunit [Candidatus Egerieousia sp.]